MRASPEWAIHMAPNSYPVTTETQVTCYYTAAEYITDNNLEKNT
jgi:hypothetical protein